jgi:hypothetical protein
LVTTSVKENIMKISALAVMLAMVALGCFAGTAVVRGDTVEGRSGHDFINQWDAFLSSDAHQDSSLALEYRYETHTRQEGRRARRWKIRFGKASPLNKGEENPFLLLDIMKNHSRIIQQASEDEGTGTILRRVEPSPEHKDVYTMSVPKAYTLKERDEKEVLSANATCQLDQGWPLRFIFTVETPRHWLTRKVQIVYTWDYSSYEYENGNKDEFWVPTDIKLEKLISRRGRNDIETQHWQLLDILEVNVTDAGDITEPEDEVQ